MRRRCFVLALSGLMAGCLGGSGGSSSSDTGATPPADILTKTTVSAATVSGAILVPKSQASKFIALNSRAQWHESLLLALSNWVPSVQAIELADFERVNAQEIRLLRFNRQSGNYAPVVVSEAQLADFNNAVTAGLDGTYTIDLIALAAAGILPEALLDTALLVEVHLELSSGGSVQLRAPLVDTTLNVSPLTELLVRRFSQAGPSGLDSISIGEARELILAANNVVVSDAGNKTIEELIGEVNKVAGVTLDEQFAEYQSPEPNSDSISVVNGEYAFVFFGEGVIGTHEQAQVDQQLGFGEYYDFLDVATTTINLNSQGVGQLQFGSGTPVIGSSAQVIQSHDGSSVTDFFTEIDGTPEGFALPAKLNGNGSLFVSDSPSSEFDSTFFQWEVSSGNSFTFRPLDFGGDKLGRIGVIRAPYEYFDDVAGAGAASEESHTSPDFSAPRFRSIDSVLAIGLPASTLAATNFNQDIGVVTLTITRDKTGFASMSVRNERLSVSPQNAGTFSGGIGDGFSIFRQLGTGSTGVGLATNEDNTDSLTLTGGAGGGISVTSSDSPNTSIKGIAAPGGAFGVLGLIGVECSDGVNSTSHDNTVVCPQGSGEPVAGEIGVGLFVPVADATTLTAGDVYSFQTYEFTSHLGSDYGTSGCRGEFVIGENSTLDFSSEDCVSVVRLGASEIDIPGLESDSSALSPIPVSVSNGLISGDPVEAPELQGYISASGSIVLLRFADPSAPDYVGIVIAQRVSGNAL